MEPITEELVEKWKEALSAAGVLEDQITDRISAIVDTIFKVSGDKYDTWYFDGAGEGEIGNIELDYDHISIIMDPYRPFWCLYDGEEIDLGYEFPTVWLYQDNIEQRVRDCHKAWKARKEAKLKAQRERKTKTNKRKEALKKSAAKKLTAEERKVIGL